MSDELTSNRKPIIYDYEMDLRFSDLDPYGHLSVKNYIDLVVSSRTLFLERVLNVPFSDFAKKGVGIYVSKSYQEYIRPVIGMRRLRVKTFVEKVVGGRFTVPYEVLDAQKGTLFSKGHLEVASVDLKSQRPLAEVPEWVLDCVFEPA